MVVFGHGPFSFVDWELHMGLVVMGSGEDLGSLGRDHSAFVDDLRVDSTFHFET